LHIRYRQWKKHILELFNVKLSKTIDQTRICKNSYSDPLGYFCMGLFVLLVPMDKWPTNFTCPTDVSTCSGQSDISYCRGLQLLAHGQWFSPASSTIKTGRHIFFLYISKHHLLKITWCLDVAEILLKVALNTKNQINKQNLNGFEYLGLKSYSKIPEIFTHRNLR
jgi:hypothetical protein